MKTKLISSVFALVLLTIVTSTYSVLSQLNSSKIAQSPSAANNLFEFGTAAAPRVKVAPVQAPSPAPTTPIETIFLAGGRSVDPISHIFSNSVNNVVYSANGSTWNQHNPVAWFPRSNHSLTYLGGLMFVMGGETNSAIEHNDVYSSTDGAYWTQISANAPWAPRSSHEAVSHNGKLFIMGGSTLTSPSSTSCGCRIYLNDVWSSTNGVNWTSLGNAPWPGRDRFASVVFNNKIWVMGGTVTNSLVPPGQNINDVWSSPDGINWTLETSNAPWNRRYAHSALVYNGKIYVIGGIETSVVLAAVNDVWSSPDGINWTQETANAGWPLRYGHKSLVFDGYMWVIGGFHYSFSPVGITVTYNDAWKSSDGINWTQQTANIPNLNGDGFAGVVMP